MNYLYNPFQEKITVASPLGITQLRELIRYEPVGNLPDENRVIEDEIFTMLLEHPSVVWYNSRRPDEALDHMGITEPWSFKVHNRYISMVAAPDRVFMLSRVQTKNFTTFYYGSTIKKTIIDRAIRFYYIDLAIRLADV